MRYPFLDLKAINQRYMHSLLEATHRVVESGRYIGGVEVDRFNELLSSMCQVPYAVGVSNGLDALRLSLEALKIAGHLQPGDGVIVAANTYIASILAITHAGLKPILVDPDPATMNLSAQGIAQGLRLGAKAVMPVHLYGRTAWDDDMRNIVLDSNLMVIEDAAQSVGAVSGTNGVFDSQHAGALGQIGAFSFYPTKNVGALGDAGAVVTHDAELAQIVKALANYGSDRRYHNIYQGYNCRLDPIQAAVLYEKLTGMDWENNRRRENATIYHMSINNPLVSKPLYLPNDLSNVWHQYVVRVDSNMRQRFIEYMTANGVGTDIHYAIPPHLQPCYESLQHNALPVTEQLANEVVSLPISSMTSTDDIQEIALIINRFQP